MTKKRDIIIIVSLMVLLISIVWIVDGTIKNQPKFLVYENTCENKTDFIPEDCLVLSDEKVNNKWVSNNCKFVLQYEGSKLFSCSYKYVIEIPSKFE